MLASRSLRQPFLDVFFPAAGCDNLTQFRFDRCELMLLRAGEIAHQTSRKIHFEFIASLAEFRDGRAWRQEWHAGIDDIAEATAWN